MNYCADFETITDENDCRVWAWAIVDVKTPSEDNVLYGNNLNEFMKYSFYRNKTIFFHNLKFDGEFIIYWLLKNGYVYSADKEDKSFSCLISSQGQFYEIDVIHKNFKTRYHHTVFRDSLKKLPFSVSIIAKAFNLKMSKLTIDYDEFRPINHRLTIEEIDYIKADVCIVAQALSHQFSRGLKKMTIGSDALNNYKDTIGGKNCFTATFPILDSMTDSDIRKAYKGGWTYVKKDIQNIEVGEGLVFDVNSLYPSVMYNKLLPYGEPLFFTGEYINDPDFPLYIQHIIVDFKLKEDKLPTIQLKNSFRFSATEYIENSDGDVELFLTNVDLELFKEHYDIVDIEYINGWKFQGKKGFFNDYIDYWGKIKATSEGGLRTLAKLMLNSLYGKFATNPDVTGKIPYLENDIVKYKKGEITTRDPVYTAMGCFITSYAREITIRTAQSVYKHFCYADTDSIHLIGISYEEISNIIDIDKTRLGAWKHEYNFTRAKFVRAKTYIEEVDGELEVKCAGMSENLKKHVTFDNFTQGSVFHGKLLPKHVKGGIILEKVDFTIK